MCPHYALLMCDIIIIILMYTCIILYLVSNDYLCTCMTLQYSEANDYSEEKRKAVESLHNKVSHNNIIIKCFTVYYVTICGKKGTIWDMFCS